MWAGASPWPRVEGRLLELRSLAGLGGSAGCLDCATDLVREVQVKLTDRNQGFGSQRKT